MAPLSSRQIARNTIALYFRTFIVLAVNLYAARVVLATMGIDDFGIYTLIGQFVAMFSIVTITLTIASQRFIAYEIGSGTTETINKVFSTSLNVHIIAAVSVFILCEILGVAYIENFVHNIPAERLEATYWVLQCSLIALVFQFLSIPYTSLVIAYEKMSVFAYISVLEALMKLGAVLVLPFLEGDSLKIYAVLILCSSVLVRFAYGLYCRMKFPDIRYRRSMDSKTLREFSSFLGWNLMGTGSQIASNQGINLLMNLFFALSINAARGLAYQIETAVSSFTRNVAIAINPSIVKNYASGHFSDMISLVNKGARFCFYLYFAISLPVILLTPQVLHIWLNDYPFELISFVRLALVNCMIQSLTFTMDTFIYATGKIKWYQILTGLCQLMILPLSWICYRMGQPAAACYNIAILATVIITIIKIQIAQRALPRGSEFNFTRDVFLRVVLVTVVASFIPLVIYRYITWTSEWGLVVIITLLCLISTGWTIYELGLHNDERTLLLNKINYYFNRIRKIITR